MTKCKDCGYEATVNSDGVCEACAKKTAEASYRLQIHTARYGNIVSNMVEAFLMENFGGKLDNFSEALDSISDIIYKNLEAKANGTTRHEEEQLGLGLARDYRSIVKADVELKSMFHKIMETIDAGHLDATKAASLREAMREALMNWMADERTQSPSPMIEASRDYRSIISQMAPMNEGAKNLMGPTTPTAQAAEAVAPEMMAKKKIKIKPKDTTRDPIMTHTLGLPNPFK